MAKTMKFAGRRWRCTAHGKRMSCKITGKIRRKSGGRRKAPVSSSVLVTSGTTSAGAWNGLKHRRKSRRSRR